MPRRGAQVGGPTRVEPIRRMPWLRDLSVGIGVWGAVPLELSRHFDLDSLVVDGIRAHPTLQ